MLVSKNTSLIEQARLLVSSVELNNAVGAISMTDVQAALGVAQLNRYPLFLERRRQIFNSYDEKISGLSNAAPCYPPKPSFLFRLTLWAHNGYEKSQASLLDHNVQARRGVDELLHQKLGLDDAEYPCATKLFSHVISLPFFPSLTLQEQSQVLNAMHKVFNVSEAN
jgi:dTDP-4-amino-4,6-dideoxygalactose transaminase